MKKMFFVIVALDFIFVHNASPASKNLLGEPSSENIAIRWE
jgi:hypothetical protein